MVKTRVAAEVSLPYWKINIERLACPARQWVLMYASISNGVEDEEKETLDPS